MKNVFSSPSYTTMLRDRVKWSSLVTLGLTFLIYNVDYKCTCQCHFVWLSSLKQEFELTMFIFIDFSLMFGKEVSSLYSIWSIQDEILPSFAVSTLVPFWAQFQRHSPNTEHFIFPLKLLNPKGGLRVGRHFGALSGKWGLVQWELRWDLPLDVWSSLYIYIF